MGCSGDSVEGISTICFGSTKEGLPWVRVGPFQKLSEVNERLEYRRFTGAVCSKKQSYGLKGNGGGSADAFEVSESDRGEVHGGKGG